MSGHKLFRVHVTGVVCAASEDDARAALGTFGDDGGDRFDVLVLPLDSDDDEHMPVAVTPGRRGRGCRFCRVGNGQGLTVGVWREESARRA